MKDRAKFYLTIIITILLFSGYISLHGTMYIDAEIACIVDEGCEFYEIPANLLSLIVGIVFLVASHQIATWIEESHDNG